MKTVPLPVSVWKSIVPPCLSTITERDIARPCPVPLPTPLVVKGVRRVFSSFSFRLRFWCCSGRDGGRYFFFVLFPGRRRCVQRPLVAVAHGAQDVVPWVVGLVPGH